MEDAEEMAKATFSDWFHMMKPGVLSLLQITAMCTILIHDLIVWNAAGRLDFDLLNTLETMAIVFVGGYLTAGGANAINMWYDRDIDAAMTRTANRPIPAGRLNSSSA